MEFLGQNLYQHVQTLSEKIGERSLAHYDKLEQTAGYIRDYFRSLGYRVDEQVYQRGKKEYRNLIAELPGSSVPDEIILLGAHYDTVVGTPGADDNASGVAGLLELARLCKDLGPKRTLRFVAFSLEEPPVFKTEHMGSRVYAQRASEQKDDIIAMLCLESIGYYSNEKDSQAYPLPLMSLFYPEQGNFIAVVGNFNSMSLLRKVARGIKRGSNVPVETLTSPAFIIGVGFSDHASFWDEGYSAVMITDSAMFRNPNYHRLSDTIDTLNFELLSETVKGVFNTIQALDKD